METSFCTSALDWALQQGQPEIFNTDQGAQFTSEAFTSRLEKQCVKVSMDGRGRAMDNVFIERLWRSVKYENIFLHDYASVNEVTAGLKRYKEKGPQRKKGRPVETAAAVEIKQGGLRQHFLDDFHSCLKKSAEKRRRLFHSYHRPDDNGYIHNINFSERLRSTLSRSLFGPKNGEPLTSRTSSSILVRPILGTVARNAH